MARTRVAGYLGLALAVCVSARNGVALSDDDRRCLDGMQRDAYNVIRPRLCRVLPGRCACAHHPSISGRCILQYAHPADQIRSGWFRDVKEQLRRSKERNCSKYQMSMKQPMKEDGGHDFLSCWCNFLIENYKK